MNNNDNSYNNYYNNKEDLKDIYNWTITVYREHRMHHM